MINKYYIVRLTPINSYYFGGEITFGEGAAQNYYVKSNYLPQASSLLGVMRYEVLRQNNLLSYDKTNRQQLEQVKYLIGEHGFNLDDDSSYGIIQKLSPVFVENKRSGKFYTPMPLDDGIQISFQSDTECSFSSVCKQSKAITMKGYDYKHYDNYRYWISGDGEKIDTKAIFYEKEQIGITKSNREDDDQDAFYKMVSVGLRDSYNFVFILETSIDINPVEKEVVYMGGNRSAFVMSIVPFENEPTDFFCTYFSSLKRSDRLLLLSDTYFTDQERNDFPFIWADMICNRYIVNQYEKGHSWNRPLKTVLYHLFARGGAIYTSETISPNPHLNRVGLNIFI